MKNLSFLLVGALWVALGACDDIIHPTLQTAEPVYTVDAFINNKLDSQVIRLMYSQPYFEQQLPPGISGAIVAITDNEGNVFSFLEDPKNKGSYFWIPSGSGFGKEGSDYTLSVTVNGESLTAQSG